MIAALALALTLVAGEPDPCSGATPQCRQAAGEAILAWRTEALTAERHLAGCEERLSVRTSTVIRELVPVPRATEPPPAEIVTPWTITAGAVGLVLGLVVGLVAAR